MSCCAYGVELAAAIGRTSSLEEVALASRDLGNGSWQTSLSVPDLHCGACIRSVEDAVSQLEGVERARANLTTRRLAVTWRGPAPPDMIAALAAVGYKAHLDEAEDRTFDPELSRLIRALAVAGFAAMNIMMLSVSIWSGAEAETRQAFHWISAALALPALLYSGGIFYRSAWRALRHGRTNMDVPISIGITLAFGLSLYDTLHHGHQAYFDAATSLIFFLLIGRTLDHAMRQRARGVIGSLMRLSPRGATVERRDGSRDYLSVGEIEPGMAIVLAAGDRVPVDGRIVSGTSHLDCALATGESMPVAVAAGSVVQAGALNLSGPLRLVATARARDSFLAEMTRLMEAAEDGRARYRRIADRAARLYSPVVHLAAFLTFLGWMVTNGDWHNATSIAIAVLIITCPCALGLAVPIVQVVAARRLFDAGIMMKDGSAIERLAEVGAVCFDKTGTLTIGTPRVDLRGISSGTLEIAGALARHSSHPVSRAIAMAAPDATKGQVEFADVTEQAGLGLEAFLDGQRYRLGRASWALGAQGVPDGTVLSCNGREVARFEMAETLRPGAVETMKLLRDAGLSVGILSGDRPSAVADIARALDVTDFTASLMPADKVARLARAKAEGRRTLMVGDGLNDAPALSAAHVSMAPATAADIGRSAADFVFLRDSLAAIPAALDIAHKAGHLVRQNFAIAIVYNALAIPVAIAGYVTPLLAALAMSVSSVIVVANALRLRPPSQAVERAGPAVAERMSAVTAE
ncbi:cadmium-translocating P-type ATPase [Labrys sp. KNU-23]|uniref:heavy metal translocating P-type ATPase n=1 Tax=Labrys sp. KNU-23 TaxID=2789216 RepID=UPI0011EF6011|nr:heavy metal translocating P-type ATPase [Labrys sp. KNU-23]QEN85782.1 cadmium-translocating P-type ATPase [Labrys sp. KNU-23]